MMSNRVGICAVAAVGVLCGCADNKPPPVMLAREGLAGDRGSFLAPSRADQKRQDRWKHNAFVRGGDRK